MYMIGLFPLLSIAFFIIQGNRLLSDEIKRTPWFIKKSPLFYKEENIQFVGNVSIRISIILFILLFVMHLLFYYTDYINQWIYLLFCIFLFIIEMVSMFIIRIYTYIRKEELK